MIPEADERKVRLPVRWQRDQWRLLEDGGPLPELHEGAVGELVVSAFSFVSNEELKAWTAEALYSFLPAKTKLRVQVKRHLIGEDLALYRHEDPNPNSPHCFVEIVLKEELQILLKPGKHATLCECSCEIPALKTTVGSVNEAYTRISEKFEPGRRSHSGNVFTKVFYLSPHGIRKLAELRSEIERGLSGGSTSLVSKNTE